jgi:hypothetical protein
MSDDIKAFLSNKEKEFPSIDEFKWSTEEELATNTDTMNEWIEYHMPEDYVLIEETLDGTYAEILDEEGHKFACHASGNGDFSNHIISFELLEVNNQLKTTMIYKDILEVDDIIALDMLFKEEIMNGAEKRHYIEGAQWEEKIERLKNDNLFNQNEMKAIEKLLSGDYLTGAEKRHYVINNNIQEKIDKLKSVSQNKLSVNDVKKAKSRNIPDIETVKKGDQLLMSFEVKGVKDHFWCDVTNVETMFKESKSQLLTIKINEDNKFDQNKMIDHGRDNKCRSSLLDYCKTVYNNLDIAEKSYNKRVLEVKSAEKMKMKMKMKIKGKISLN